MARHGITRLKYFPSVLILGLQSDRGRVVWVPFSLNFIHLQLRDEFKCLQILRSHKTRRPKRVTTRTPWVVNNSGSLTKFFHPLTPNDLQLRYSLHLRLLHFIYVGLSPLSYFIGYIGNIFLTYEYITIPCQS